MQSVRRDKSPNLDSAEVLYGAKFDKTNANRASQPMISHTLQAKSVDYKRMQKSANTLHGSPNLKQMIQKQLQEQVGPADDLKFSNVNVSLAKKNLTRMRLNPLDTIERLEAGQI